MFCLETIISFVALDVTVKGSSWNVQCIAKGTDIKLAVEWFQGDKLFLCGCTGNAGSGFQYRNFAPVFVAAEKGV